MDRETTEYLQMLLRKDISELTPLDLGFLRARASYLNDEQLERIKPLFPREAKTKGKSPEIEVTEEVLNDKGIFIEELETGFLVSKCESDESFMYYGKKSSSLDQESVMDVFTKREDALKHAVKLL